MTVQYGWVGKILRVDLSTSSVSEVDTDQYREYIGGLGIGAKIAWEEIPNGTGAFDPENKLIFMTGPLGGIPIVPGAGRAALCSISPHTHPSESFSYSNMGGDWPVELKFAGYDGLIIQGQADRPVFISIANDQVEIRDAESLWGLDTIQTQKSIASILSDRDVRSVCIGVAGENQVRFASIISDTGSAFGQGGFGAVMGSKKLKAITVRGTGAVSIAKPKKFLDMARYSLNLKNGSALWPTRKDGFIWGTNSGHGLHEAGYGLHPEACRGCGHACRGFFRMPGLPPAQAVCVQFFYGVARDPANDGVKKGDKATWLAKTLGDTLGLNLVELSGMLFWLRDAFRKD